MVKEKTGRVLGYALFIMSVVCVLAIVGLCLAQREDSRTFVVTALVVNSSGNPMRNCFVSFTPKSSRRTDAMARYTGVDGKVTQALPADTWEAQTVCSVDPEGVMPYPGGKTREATAVVDVTGDTAVRLVV